MVMLMNDLYERILKVFSAFPDTLFGISGLNFSGYQSHYQCALVVAVPHAKRTRIPDYHENEFELLIQRARKRAMGIIDEIAALLRRYGVAYCIPAPSQTSEGELTALLSYKYAAVNAGLGWIGKNDVLITEQYGPEVTLYAMLIDSNLPLGTPVTESKCPPECDLCLKACPYSALTGKLWRAASNRWEIIDYHLCNQKRSLYQINHGRKHACGLCMAACPIGVNDIKTKETED